MYYQANRFRAVAAENPASARSWDQPPLKAAFGRPDMSETVMDMCAFGKVRPDTGLHVRKKTRIEGTPEVCEAVSRRCPGGHKHQAIEGTMKLDTPSGKRSVPVSTWAGGYTQVLCTYVLNGAEKYLQNRDKNIYRPFQ